MSFTFTSTPEKTASRTTTASIYLSPSKRRRITPPLTPHVQTRHLTKEIWSWTFKPDAVATCSVKDALDMKENELEHFDFFWLGSVPCRIVKVVGMVVGIQVYEKKILYTIDDGTGVLDCSHPQSLPKPLPKEVTTPSKYQRPEKLEPPTMPKPITRIGQFVRVQGKVCNVYDSRHIRVHSIDVCDSPNDELVHTRTVRELHRTLYSKKEPFVIPPSTYSTFPTTPKKTYAPPTPSTRQTSPPSSVSSSPIKPEQIIQSPIKLRHPSRLHTHDLTDNTFRIYLKHYMDNAPTSEVDYDSDTDIAGSFPQAPSTPTKRSYANETPRQKPRQLQHDFTPRPRIPQPAFGRCTNIGSCSTQPPNSSQTDSARKGFTLSYLRRVPELSLLASRVVHAVARRRQREERKRQKEAGIVPSKSQRSSSSTIPPDKFAAKMKRLFQWAVVQLLKEGCIALWDGQKRTHTEWSRTNTSLLWKANATTSTTGGDSTLFSTASSSLPPPFADEDEGTLSDPDSNEEAYIPLTPYYLGEFVEKAIKVLVNHYETIGKPYLGATKEGVLSVLRKDDRWRYVGEWSIDDTLVFLKQEGTVWCLGNGRWDLTG